MFEKCLFKHFKGKNTLFFLKILLANSSFLIFPNKNSRYLSFFGNYNVGGMPARYTLCARYNLCAHCIMYGKPVMTCFKYQVYMYSYGSEIITHLNAILCVVTEPAL
jgi:hypothetical protein